MDTNQHNPMQSTEGLNEQPINQQQTTNKLLQSQNPLPSNSKQTCLRSQLLAMQFEQPLIDRALQMTEDLQKAIEIIVSLLEEQDLQTIAKQDTVAIIFLVRTDLKMSIGKIAAQCAHATLKAFQLARHRAQYEDTYSLTFINWLQTGQQKVYLKVQSQNQLYALLNNLKAKGQNTCFIRDAGRTQVAAGSTTVGAVGPCYLKSTDELIGKLNKL